MKHFALIFLVLALCGCTSTLHIAKSPSVETTKFATLPISPTRTLYSTQTPIPEQTINSLSQLDLRSLLLPGEYLVDFSDFLSQSETTSIKIYSSEGNEVKALNLKPNGVFSPNLRYLFSPNRNMENNFPILIDLVTGKSSEITNRLKVCPYPSWSPDSNYIIANCTTGYSSNLYLISIADGSAKLLKFCENGDYLCDHPVWSPDGKLIVFYLSEPVGGATPKIEGMHFLDTLCFSSTSNCLLNDIGLEASPSYTWSPDSNYLAETADNGIIVYRVEDNKLLQPRFFNVGSNIVSDTWMSSISWSPSGKWIAANTEKGVVLVAVDSGKLTFLNSDIKGFDYWISVP